MTNNGFTPMTAAPMQKRYAKGYLEAMEKAGQSAAKALVIIGAILAVIGALIGYGVINFLMSAPKGNSDDTILVIIFGVLALLFLLPGILSILWGRKKKGMNADEYLHKIVKASGYPESVVRDFSSQVPNPDSFYFDIYGPMLKAGILTNDYIFLENGRFCLMKRSDITGVYLVNWPDVINVGNKVKKVFILEIVIFSNHNTYTMSEASQKRAEQLVAMLTDQHPEIDTAGGKKISAEECEKMMKAIQ